MGLSIAEKTIIDITDTTKYDIYRCPEHGIYTMRKDIVSHVCPYCKKECEEYVKE